MGDKATLTLEEAEVKAKEIQFWRSEYMKRKLIISEDGYSDIVTKFSKFSLKWNRYLKERHPDLLLEYQKNFSIHLQGAHILMLLLNQKWTDPDNDICITECFSDFLNDPEIYNYLQLFTSISHKYDYSIEDLLSPKDMSDILINIDDNLPEPPLFFINTHYHRVFDENVLSLIRVNNTARFEMTDESKWGFRPEKYKAYCDLGNFISINNLQRVADFAISGQALHEDFDLKLAMQEIQDHIVWTISENKRQLKLELKDNERNAIIDLYCRMALGEYGSTYKESRAIGLWLWDRIYMKKNSKTKADAVKAFKEQCKNNSKFAKGHSGSSDRTLLRLLENTENCINSGEVKSIKKIKKND